MSSNIKVAVRCRPLFEKEKPAVGLDIQSRRIALDLKTYDPDYTFHPTSSQEEVFACCSPIIQSVKDGLNGTIMVYGQTGTGKTHTMLGTDSTNGVVYCTVQDLLQHVQRRTLEGAQIALTLAMVEIYNEKITDMLSPNGDVEVTLVAGFPRTTTRVTLGELSDAVSAIERGLTWRRTASTLMNDRSSRSHVVIMLDLEELNPCTNTTEVAHLFLVDLAGSESLKKSQAVGVVAAEAGKINKSLLALKSVFLALSNTNEATRPTHVPYRDSKLTEMLQDSIGGTARTLLIACISAVGRDLEETKSTLMYACKARSIRNSANTEREKLLIRLRSYEVENQRLRNRLEERVSERGGYYVNREDHERYQQLEEENANLHRDVEQLIKDHKESEARTHISTSQVKILQRMYEERDAVLRQFKELHYHALRRFENQSEVIAKLVQHGVATARGLFAANQQHCHQAFVAWKAAFTTGLVDATAPGARGTAGGEADGHGDGNHPARAPSRDPAPERGGQPSPTLPPPPLPSDEARAIERVVSAVNQSFVELTGAFVALARDFCREREEVARRRSEALRGFAARLTESVASQLAQLETGHAALEADDATALELFRHSVTSKAAYPAPASALPLVHLVDNARVAAVRAAEEALAPSLLADGLPDDLEAALRHVTEDVRRHTNAVLLGALEPLQSAPAQCLTAPLPPPATTRASTAPHGGSLSSARSTTVPAAGTSPGRSAPGGGPAYRGSARPRLDGSLQASPGTASTQSVPGGMPRASLADGKENTAPASHAGGSAGPAFAALAGGGAKRSPPPSSGPGGALRKRLRSNTSTSSHSAPSQDDGGSGTGSALRHRLAATQTGGGSGRWGSGDRSRPRRGAAGPPPAR